MRRLTRDDTEHGHAYCLAAEADAEIAALRKRAEEAEADAARWAYCVKFATWHRGEERTHMAVPVAADADLSCIATRTAAIDAARKETPNAKLNGGP